MAAHLSNGDAGGCELARLAMVRASDALDGQRNVYEALGGVTRELAGNRAAAEAGFASMGRRLDKLDERLRSTRAMAREASDSSHAHVEQELKNLRNSAQFWKRWVLGIVAAVIGTGLCTLVVLGIKAIVRH